MFAVYKLARRAVLDGQSVETSTRRMPFEVCGNYQMIALYNGICEIFI
jgi:hypothetical protein